MRSAMLSVMASHISACVGSASLRLSTLATDSAQAEDDHAVTDRSAESDIADIALLAR